MYRRLTLLIVLCGMFVLVAGCGNPLKRPPANVFPGSKEYEDRVATFKITPKQAYDIAHEEAVTDNKLQFLSRKPTVVVKRWYVFSMPQGSGAQLQGYHVHGDSGEVRFHAEKRTVTSRN